jgi:putative ABC transport system permease protein
VLTIALGDAADRAVKAQVGALGDNSLTIQPERIDRTQGAGGGPGEARLTEHDAHALGRDGLSIARAAPVLSSNASVAFGGFRTNAEVIGSERQYLRIRSWEVELGELWSDAAENTGARVCLLGQTVARELFDGANPVGRVVRIGKHPFVVVGQLAPKGPHPTGQDQDNTVIVPLEAMRSRIKPTTRVGQVDQILLSASDAETLKLAEEQATQLLRQRHGLAEGVDSDFRIRGQDAFNQTQARIVSVLSLLLTSIAAVSLVVGGIGIMNIMLVSVAERTRDIGIRMAIGATAQDIMAQFLVEALVLSGFGGLLGILVSVAASGLLRGTLGLPLAPSGKAMLVALAVSSGTGLVFGLLPARRAARLDPMVALRRE